MIVLAVPVLTVALAAVSGTLERPNGGWGRLELDEWQTDAGERRSRHKVVADEVEFLGGRQSDDDETGL